MASSTSTFHPTYTPMKQPYSKTSVGFFRDNGENAYGNCCWCGALMKGLQHDAKANMNKAIRCYCSKCGKANIVQFHWSLTVESIPEVE
jgi:hypothetical protein